MWLLLNLVLAGAQFEADVSSLLAARDAGEPPRAALVARAAALAPALWLALSALLETDGPETRRRAARAAAGGAIGSAWEEVGGGGGGNGDGEGDGGPHGESTASFLSKFWWAHQRR